MDELPEGAQCMVDGGFGVYVPQTFVERNQALHDPLDWNLRDEDRDVLLQGPDAEEYWEAWDAALGSAYYVDEDGVRWLLYQDSDLFMYPAPVE